MKKSHTDYLILLAGCEHGCKCGGSATTLRSENGKYYLHTATACVGSQMEISEELFNALVHHYIAQHGELPPAY